MPRNRSFFLAGFILCLFGFTPASWAAPLGLTSDSGHDPGQLAWGLGSRSAHIFEELRFRPAYQDLLSDPTGYLGHSQIEIFRVSMRYYNSPHVFELQDLTAIDMVALAPWSEFSQPLSWKLNLGLRRLDDKPFAAPTALSLNGGPGATLAPFKTKFILLSAFAQAHSDSCADLHDKTRFGTSAQFQALYSSKRFRLLSGAEYRSYFLGERSSAPRFMAAVSYSLSRNWESRFDWTQNYRVTENRGLLLWHLLF